MTSAERKAAIVAAAIELFSNRGFRGTTTRELARAVGVSEPVLYEHFQSKRELFRAVIEAKFREKRERVDSLLASATAAGDDRAFFQQLGEVMLQGYRDEPAFFRLLLFLALESDELAAVLYERHVLTHRRVAAYIRQRLGQGAFHGVDPDLAARTFVGMVVNHGMMRMFFQDRLVKGSPKRIVAGMVGIFLEGMRSSKRGVQ